MQPHLGHYTAAICLWGSAPLLSTWTCRVGKCFNTCAAAGAPVRFLRGGRDLPPSLSSTALPCGPRSSMLPSAPPSFLNSLPSNRAVLKNTYSGGYGTRTPPRSGNRSHHCAPRLAFYQNPNGLGSHHITRRRGSIYYLPRAVLVPQTRASRPVPKDAIAIIFYLFENSHITC